ncbi:MULTISPECIES: CHAT domain-containing protein [unclassified Mesorhizobium]|uniref:CHAT domain-containing protein n=1 Tax=unclassified Mesorhizobium TaxID=325217 RepID=UPI001CCA81D1|nr:MULTISPECIES: CHAT domain-containing protein [unclassified Mesorhizobium]MBZ9919986.1 CHAT domain-containing protein [Mesorhizobium sp. BR1-1-7]MBZ9954813.1 CHAT domain-containing protein [Mesorhizobium sp. BR1-1-15]MBZ9970986.1 CHAT domain-containing protein [Mesorhizobium sp. BR1-1-12]
MSDTDPRETQNDRIDLCVVHGHLAFARFPVLVGHYIGDTFAGTEARLDRALGFRLTERRKLGLYPGRIGTCAILVDPSWRPSGAVVVGLGQPASLSIGALRETLRRGILAFMVESLDRAYVGANSADPKAPMGLSTLLVGAGGVGLDRNSCVQALLQATSQANAMLAGLQRNGARLSVVEIIELYEDRAYETWRAVRKAIENDPVLEGVFRLPPRFSPRGGGRRNAPISPDPNWWEPIQITVPPVGRAEDRTLSFTVGGGFARTEARTIAANLDIVAPLMRRTAQNVDLDGAPISPGRILFELLWPESLKHRSAEEQNKRLILDEQSAAFPWELLDDRRPWMSAEDTNAPKLAPPAVRAGIVRQLLQTQFSEKVFAARGKPKALVIGDPGAEPMKGFGALPGAEAEATALAELLGATRQSHDVTLLVKAAATPNQIFKQLLGQAWEIVHISAHGVVDYDMTGADGVNRRVTGVVLGDGVVMGPSVLSKLPVSPAVFFVNCCNLGKIDATAEDKARQESLEGRPELAASVAVQLIQLGVRCVVVAGWEVDDDCAKAFGLRFYSEMLDGARFGEATLRARRAAYETKPDNNSWGAFQCYGDPDYRLRVVPAPPAATDEADQFVGVSEAIMAAEQISGDVNVGLERDLKVQQDRLVKIEGEAMRKGWLKSAPLCAALAEARAELGALPEAIDYYSAAIKNETAAFKLKAVEQLANLRSRNAVSEFRRGLAEGKSPADAIAAIQDALTKVVSLTEAVGPTPERLSLEAGCWKRLAQVQPSDPAANDALKRMRECAEMAVELGGNDYPRLIAYNAAICLALRDGTACDAVVGRDLQRIVEQPAPDEADFWTLIQSPDARTTVAIMNAAQEDSGTIKNAYKRVWRYIGSPVKMRSVTEQLEFYEDIFRGGASETDTTRQRIRVWVAELRQFIESEFLAK